MPSLGMPLPNRANAKTSPPVLWAYGSSAFQTGQTLFCPCSYKFFVLLLHVLSLLRSVRGTVRVVFIFCYALRQTFQTNQFYYPSWIPHREKKNTVPEGASTVMSFKFITLHWGYVTLTMVLQWDIPTPFQSEKQSGMQYKSLTLNKTSLCSYQVKNRIHNRMQTHFILS